ncbi:hypothetical protein CRE_11541 [Caenorhabditis remanei]|uniref:Protein kinase domain-containing protein n=1 Tax=Caenorhabditis remanei TaxID=31234 RepID=E3NNK8_CAERE|nr:hypothetical protein CRE_11541 [Caenorhabditis remanei]
MVQDVSNALVYCHRRGIIHRDLKPQNILHSNENIFKISDFGTATDERDNTYCGTLDFMAPELLCRVKQSTSVDCFALGLIVHLCNEGRLPFLLADGQECDEMKTKCSYEPPADMILKIQEVTRN